MTRTPTPGRYDVDSGTAELLGDADRPGSWVLLVDGTPQSHVDLDDPAYLDFEYVRRIGHAVDLVAPTGEPIDVVHLGAGALTLARYVGTTRHGSRQRAFDDDAALVALVRRELPLPRGAAVRVRSVDARQGVAGLPAASADLVICDVFRGARTPAHLTSREFDVELARVLRPTGIAAINVGDGPPLEFTRAVAVTLRSVFARVCLLADPAVLRRRRYGNLVLLASAAELPLAQLVRRVAADPAPGRVVAGRDLTAFSGGGRARVIVDATAADSPEPPTELFATPLRGRPARR